MLSPLAVIATVLAASAASTADSPRCRLATFDTSTRETYFALSLMPGKRPVSDQAVDVVVIFDTSASQTGRYRDDGLSVLKTMLAGLNQRCRARLMAADVRPVSLNDGFVEPAGAEMAQAVAKLQRRAPLGATDMNAALRGALACFAGRQGGLRSIVFIGDGLSRANVLEAEEFRKLIADLVQRRASVSSFAIGPQRDVHLLAALANHTGGMVFVDSDEANVAQRAGTALADVATGTVVWPVSVTLPEAVREAYPSPMPPFRFDRDTILIGILGDRQPLQIAVTAEMAGKRVELSWNATPEPSSDEFGFLPELVAETRDDGGLTLPTVGSAGLREAGRTILASAEDLLKLGIRALKTGDLEGAQTVTASVLARDPTNPQALALKRAIEKKNAGGKTDETPLILKLK